jgi:hypothetical protein
MKLSSEAVQSITMVCLYKPDEIGKEIPPEGAVLVDGIVHNYAFHPDRIKDQKKNIDDLLWQLHPNFQRDKGGGWSFLNGALDKDGRQWGEQRDVEALVCLGIGVGSASWLMKEMASAMPGGVPFFEVHPEKEMKDVEQSRPNENS